MIEDLLRRNEGKTLEYKENTKSLSGIVRTVVAFANTAGGVLLIGVRDKDKALIGVSNPLKKEEKLANAVSDSISPLMIPDIEICSLRDRQFLVVTVPHIASGPSYVKSKGPEAGVYIRLGSTNRQADAETISNLKLNASNKSFDELITTADTIDRKYLKTIFRRVRKSPTDKQCQSLGIYADKTTPLTPTLGGVLMFGKDRLKALPDSAIRCARFQGLTRTTFIDAKDIETPLPTAIDEAVMFVERHSQTRYVIDKIVRTEESQFPPLAVREAVINSVLHSDYSMKGTSIQIAIFDDRIEITNPGGLPYGQTMEKAMSGYSRLRNRVLGRVLQELRVIERWGSGIPRIIDLCVQAGLKPPRFEEAGNHFRTTIFSEPVGESDLQEAEVALIEHLQSVGETTTQQAAELWKVSTRQARTKLNQMRDKGILVKLATAESDPYAVFILSDPYIYL